MAQYVTVKFVRGSILGEIRIDSAGAIDVRTADVRARTPLLALVERLVAAGLTRNAPSLGLSHRSHGTRLVKESRGSAGFARALADAITRSAETIEGRRIRAWIDDDHGPQ